MQAIIVFQWFFLELTQLTSLYYFNRIYNDFYHIFSATMICLPFKNFVYVQMIHFYFLLDLFAYQ